jgi:hypothetical protein
VNDRNPPPLLAEPALLEPVLKEPVFARSVFVRSEFAALDDRPLLLGGANERLPSLRFAELFSLSPAVPALGFCIELYAVAPRNPADVPALVRPPAEIAPTWFDAIDCRRLAVCCWNDAGRATLLCEPKKFCEPPLRIVEGAAARPLADRLARDGTTGRLPAIMRAPLNCARLAPMAVTRPAPKRPAFTVESARPT